MNDTTIHPASPLTTPDCCPACGAIKDGTAAARRCAACGTVWIPDRRNYDYRDDYPAERGHFDDMIRRCKQVTLAAWINRAGISLSRRRVLEVGFGGGATLSWLAQQQADVYGQEVVASNRAAASQLGILPDHVKATLNEFQGNCFDVVLYLDAFEHILDPATQLRQLSELTRAGSKALLVLPVADSVSRTVLRGLWPHDLPDHWVFYSSRGLADLWRQFGWRQIARFYPWKYISAATAARHLAIKTGLPVPTRGLEKIGFWLNFGERGFVFERT